MSYELKISPRERAVGRFIGSVRKSLLHAAIEEKTLSKTSQQAVADALGVNRSVINKILRGQSNLTLRSVAEIAWALGWLPSFSMRRKPSKTDGNHFEPTVVAPTATVGTSSANSVLFDNGQGASAAKADTIATFNLVISS